MITSIVLEEDEESKKEETSLKGKAEEGE